MTGNSFGNPTNANLSTRYHDANREFDSFTDLHYYRARWFDTQLGRFISEDPIGLAGGINQFFIKISDKFTYSIVYDNSLCSPNTERLDFT